MTMNRFLSATSMSRLIMLCLAEAPPQSGACLPL
jgi:hypothetical protein